MVLNISGLETFSRLSKIHEQSQEQSIKLISDYLHSDCLHLKPFTFIFIVKYLSVNSVSINHHHFVDPKLQHLKHRSNSTG